MKFTLNKARRFGWNGLKCWAYRLNDFKTASAAYIEVRGRHGKICNSRSNRVYWVVSGKGKFWMGGRWVAVEEKDVIAIPKNVPYDYKSQKNSSLKLFLVDCPPFDPAFETKLE